MTTPIAAAVELHEKLADADLPQEFQLAAFPVLLERVLGSTETQTPTGSSKTPPAADDQQPGDPPADGGKLASRVGREQDQLEDIYDFSASPVALIVSPGKLKTAKAKATIQIALLVVAARQGAGGEEWTKTTEIRRVAQDYSRFDSANFAATLKSMHEEFAFRGKGHGREVRLTRPGWEAVSSLLADLGA